MKKKYILAGIGIIFTFLMIKNYSLPARPESLVFSGRTIKTMKVFKDYGKSLDWSHSKNQIAFGKLGEDNYYDIYIMDADGGSEWCLTCTREGIPQKHNGNPSWHPSGEFIAFTAEKEEVPKQFDRWAIPGTGLNADLWLATSDGQRFYQLTNLPLNNTAEAKGTIHPQFSPDAKKLLWAERVGSGGAWGKWVLKVADFVVEQGEPRFENIKTFAPGEQQIFYESHGFSPDSQKIIFSGNLSPNQPEYGLDIYELDLTSEKLTNLTHSFSDWDEHAHYSPDGKKIAWMSSTGLEINWSDIKGHNWQKSIKASFG